MAADVSKEIPRILAELLALLELDPGQVVSIEITPGQLVARDTDGRRQGGGWLETYRTWTWSWTQATVRAATYSPVTGADGP